MIGRRKILTAWIAVLVALGLIAGGQCAEVAPLSDGERIDPGARYRRVFAPADRVQQWPINQAHYLPIDAAEFERLVKAAEDRASGMATPIAARLVHAQYKARLDGDRLLGGQARWEVVHSAKRAVRLPLPPCRLAVRDPQWITDNSTESEAEPVAADAAILGVGRTGNLELLIDRSGSLEFNWSLAGSRETDGQSVFHFELPPCATTRLTLDLPKEVMPVVEGAVVLCEEPLENGDTDTPTQVWHLELGGNHRFALRIVPTEAVASSQMVPVRQTHEYRFSPRGLHVTMNLTLDPHQQPVRKVILSVDRPLQVVRATCDKVEIPWTDLSTADDPAGRIAFALPESEEGRKEVAERLLQVTSVTSTVTDRRWRLPRIRAEDVFWQEGTATLVVPDPLEANRLVPIDGRQSGAEDLSAPQTGRRMQFQYFSPDATVEVLLSRRAGTLKITSGTQVELRAGEMTAHVRADVRAFDAPGFDLSAEIAPDWIVESVDCTPTDAIDDWNVDRRGGKQTLTVRLAKALSPEQNDETTQPVRLAINARQHRSPLGQALRVSDLIPVRFDAANRRDALVAVRAAEPYRLEMTGQRQVAFLDPAGMEPSHRALFADLSRARLFRNDATASALRITLARQDAAYRGTIHVEALIADGSLLERYTLRCFPTSGRVARVVAHFSHRRDEPVHWTLAQHDHRQLTARALSIDEQVAMGLDPAEETWELILRQPQNGEFEITGSRKTALAGQQPISLVLLQNAAEQQADLVVRSSDRSAVQIENHRLVSIPAETVSANQSQAALATYRYDPVRDVAAANSAAVTVRRCDWSDTLPVWVWRSQLQSHYQTDGAGWHLATFQLQSAAAGRVLLELPGDVEFDAVRGVWVDGVRANRTRCEEGDKRCLQVEFPAGKKFPGLVVEFITRPIRLGAIGSLTPPIPRLRLPREDRSLDGGKGRPIAYLPVFSGDWTVWLPSGYTSHSPDLRCQESRVPRLTWSRRILGPLGRSDQVGPFDPLNGSTWLDSSGDRSMNRAAMRHAQRLLEQLGATTVQGTSGRENGDLDWGQLLAAGPAEASHVPLLINRQAVSRLGLSTRTLVPQVAADLPGVSRGVYRLHRAGLALLVHGDALVLTSQLDAALNRTYLAATKHPMLWLVQPGPLADQLQIANHGTGGSLQPVETWSQTLPSPAAPWKDLRVSGNRSADIYGWTAYRLDTPKSLPIRLKYVRPATVRWIASIVFLLGVAVGLWKSLRRPVLLTVLAGLFGLTTLAIPDAYTPVASAAALSMLFCLAWRLIDGRCRKVKSGLTGKGDVSVNGDLPSTVLRTGIAIALTFGLSMASVTLFAQEPSDVPAATVQPPHRTVNEPASEQPRPPLYQVLVPIDSEKRPTGGKYYIPAEFYQLLYSESAAQRGPQGWLIGGAVYRGTVSRAANSQQLSVDQLTGILDLHVLGPAARVRIPLSRTGGLLPDGVVLDGRRAEPTWEADGSAFFLDVEQPGKHRLQLSLRPQPYSDETSAGFDLAIPALPTSRLELDLPSDVPQIEIPTAIGSVAWGSDPSKCVVELGPVEKISVRWRPAAPASGGIEPVSVEELLWLKVLQGSVAIEAKLNLKIPGGELQQLRLAVDPRLQLRQIHGDDSPVFHATPGNPRIITLEWPKPVSDRVTVHATFLLTETSSVGNLRLPRLEVLDATSARRWLAISVDKGLTHKVSSSGVETAMAVADFMSDWGREPLQPLSAYDLTAMESGPRPPLWSISTQPEAPDTTAVQTLALGVRQESIQVELSAELTTTEGYVFQYQIAAPPGLQIERVSVLEEGAQTFDRSFQDKDGTVTIFLKRPAGHQQLLLSGRLPINGQARIPLPVLQLKQCEIQSSTIELFRQSSVMVAVDRPSGLVEEEDRLSTESRPQWGHLFRQYRVETGSVAKASLTVSANRPEARVQHLTLLRNDGETWTTETRCRLQVSRGLVDEIHLALPAAFGLPYAVEADPPATFTSADNGDLIVRPESAIRGEYQFSLFGPVRLVPGDRLPLPTIRFPNVTREERFVALPNKMAGRSIEWQRIGLKEAQPPNGLFTEPDDSTWTTYTATGEPSQVTLVLPELARNTARVRLADIRVSWQVDGSCHGVASFDLMPGTSRVCPLSLPKRYRLVQVSVAGVPTIPISTGSPRRWRVPLGPEALPQRIEVVFAGTAHTAYGSGTCELDSPTLGDLPVDTTHWTVAGPAIFTPGQAELGRPISPWRADLARLESITSMIEFGSASPARNPEDAARWYRRWVDRFLQTQESLDRQRALFDGRQTRRMVSAQMEQLARRQAQVAERLEQTALYGQLSSESLVLDHPAELWDWSLDQRRVASRWTVSGAASSIRVTYDSATSARWPYRLIGALGLIIVVGLFLVGLRQGILTATFQRWPHAMGVIVGLVWWLWLWPSMFGWVIVLVSVVASLRSAWRPSHPAGGSTIITIHSNH